MNKVRRMTAQDFPECFNCNKRHLCPIQCPAMSYNLYTDMTIPFEQACFVSDMLKSISRK